MRLATVPVSRVFTTGISRNKEIHLNVLIEDDSKILGHPLLVFYPPKAARKVLARPKYSAHLYEARSGISILTEEYLIFQTVWPTDSSATHIRGQWEYFVCRNHAGSDSYRGGGLHRQKSRRQRENLVCRNHAGSYSYRGGGLHRQKSRRQRQSPLCSGCFASGIPQGRHLQMPGRSWRAGQPSGDGKPVGPDVPP